MIDSAEENEIWKYFISEINLMTYTLGVETTLRLVSVIMQYMACLQLNQLFHYKRRLWLVRALKLRNAKEWCQVIHSSNTWGCASGFVHLNSLCPTTYCSTHLFATSVWASCHCRVNVYFLISSPFVFYMIKMIIDSKLKLLRPCWYAFTLLAAFLVLYWKNSDDRQVRLNFIMNQIDKSRAFINFWKLQGAAEAQS